MANPEIERDVRFGRRELGFPAVALQRRWPLVLGFGVLLMVMGLLAVGSSTVATIASVYLFAGILIASGVVEIVLTLSARGWAGGVPHLIIGVLAFVVGVIMTQAPILGAAALTLFMASWLFVSGLGQAIHAVMDRFPNWGWGLFTGIIGGLLGLALLYHWPIASLWFIGLYMGIALAFYGLSWVSFALMLRRGSTAGWGRPTREPAT